MRIRLGPKNTLIAKIGRLLLGLFLALFLFANMAAASPADGGYAPPPSCPAHIEHDEACGYVAGDPGHPCEHQHTAACYLTILDCPYLADDAYPGEDGDSTPPHVHTMACYVRVLACEHVHDVACGYAAAIEGQPCDHTCSLCASADNPGLRAASEAATMAAVVGAAPANPAKNDERAAPSGSRESAEGGSLKIDVEAFDLESNPRRTPIGEDIYVGLFSSDGGMIEGIEPIKLAWDDASRKYAPVIFESLPPGDYYVDELVLRNGAYVPAAAPEAEFPYYVAGGDGKGVSIGQDAGGAASTIWNIERFATASIEATVEDQPQGGGASPDDPGLTLTIAREDGGYIVGNKKEIPLTLARDAAMAGWAAREEIRLPAGRYLVRGTSGSGGAPESFDMSCTVNGLPADVDPATHAAMFAIGYRDLDGIDASSSAPQSAPKIEIRVIGRAPGQAPVGESTATESRPVGAATIEIAVILVDGEGNRAPTDELERFAFRIEYRETEGGPVARTFYQVLPVQPAQSEASLTIIELPQGYYTVTEISGNLRYALNGAGGVTRQLAEEGCAFAFEGRKVDAPWHSHSAQATSEMPGFGGE